MNVEKKIANAAATIRARRARENGSYEVTDELDDAFDNEESVTTTLDAVLAATVNHQTKCAKRLRDSADKLAAIAKTEK